MKITLPHIIGSYAIDIGETKDTNGNSFLVYQSTNTDTGVIEAETSSLPRAIMATQSAQLLLDQLLGHTGKAPTVEELIDLEAQLDHAEQGDGPKH